MAGFRKAKAEQAALKLGLYGPAGSGKTFTALLIAEGLAKLTGKRIAYVDTERGTDFYSQRVPERRVHPEAFDFDALYTRQITEASSAIKSLSPDRYSVIVVDSISHMWEAALAAYAGKTTKAGTIPFHAWGPIKKPYKDLVAYLLSTPMHWIVCGRQKNIWETDEESKELKCVGTTMRAEGETPYEPHILAKMEADRREKGSVVITAFVEKDRTGVLAGRTIDWPNFDTFCRPILPLLGNTQAHIPTEDETAGIDAERLTQDEKEREEESAARLEEWKARFTLAKSEPDLAAIAKQLTPEVKARMLPAHVSELREHYHELDRRLRAGAMMGHFAPPVASTDPIPPTIPAPIPPTIPAPAPLPDPEPDERRPPSEEEMLEHEYLEAIDALTVQTDMRNVVKRARADDRLSVQAQDRLAEHAEEHWLLVKAARGERGNGPAKAAKKADPQRSLV